jgi:hypothetical protein
MGAGSSPLGAAPAGFDELAATAASLVKRPAALKIDGQTKDFVSDGAGGYETVHPVDAKFFNRLRIAQGSISSAPGLGQGISSLQWIDPLTINAFVTDQVTLATQDMVDAGEVKIHQILVDTQTRGRVMFQVDYTNLLTGNRDTTPLL